MAEDADSKSEQYDPMKVQYKIEHDKDTFFGALDSNLDRLLTIPDAALQYFIPPRILELSDDPNQVQAVKIPDATCLQLVIIDKKKPSYQGNFRTKHPDWQQYNLVGAKEYIYLEVSLMSNPFNKKILGVSDYNDRPENTHKGIASSFYSRLRDISRALGYRFITGWNESRNITFFTVDTESKGLGRYQLKHVQPDKRAEFLSDSLNSKHESLEYFTIDFLYPEDTQQYLA